MPAQVRSWLNLTLNYSISTISLASVGHLGTTELAAAALVRHYVNHNSHSF